MVATKGAHVGLQVKALIDQRGWSLGKLSERSGLDKGYLSQLTRGKVANPGVVTLGKLSDALGVDVWQLTGERPMPRRQAEIFHGVVLVPLMRARVQASGSPAWDDTRESVPIDTTVAAGRLNIMAAVVVGHCMEPVVMSGERIVFDPDATPQHRDMVVVLTEDGETIVKWFRIDPLGRAYLTAEDGTEIRPNGARIVGVVLTIDRRAPRDPRP